MREFVDEIWTVKNELIDFKNFIECVINIYEYDWLIDWIVLNSVFSAVSAIFQPCYGGNDEHDKNDI